MGQVRPLPHHHAVDLFARLAPRELGGRVVLLLGLVEVDALGGPAPRKSNWACIGLHAPTTPIRTGKVGVGVGVGVDSQRVGT